MRAGLLLLFLLANALAKISLSVVSIDCVGFEKLESLKSRISQQGESWWVELGSRLLVATDASTYNYITANQFTVSHINVMYQGLNSMVLVQRAHPISIEEAKLREIGDIIISSHGFSIVQRSSIGNQEILSNIMNNQDFKVLPMKANSVLVSASCNNEEYSLIKSGRRKADVTIKALVDSINQTRWTTDLQYLTSLNRYAGNSGIQTAETYIKSSLGANPGITVFTQSFNAGNIPCRNVIGWLPGTSNPNSWIIVGGHYDSISQATSTAAPGAEDNGSGTVSVLEMARIFAANPPPVTMIFILYSGEEEGLYGSIAHAQSILDTNNASKVIFAHTMDMVGYQDPSSSTEAVLLESSSSFQYLFSTYSAAAAAFAVNGLQTTTSLNPFGSDHVPYIDRNIPALLIIDNDWDIYPYYHKTTDTFDKVKLPIAMDILRMNVGALGNFANYTGSMTTESDASSSSFIQVQSFAIFALLGFLFI